MSFKTFLQENAVAGSTGAGSIAVNMAGDSRKAGSARDDAHKWRENTGPSEEDKKYSKMREELAKAKKLKDDQKKKKSFKSWLFKRDINEDFDMNDIVSRLKSADVQTAGSDIGVVSYGIEDDKGNVMRVTVRADQAKDFEETIAKQLADNKDNKVNGINLKGNSLAEMLFNLRDQFEIITVDFPIIPKDVVYNASQATKTTEAPVMPDSSEEFGNSMDAPLDDDMDQNMDQNPDMANDQTLPMGDDTGGMEGQADELNPDMEEGDNVEDFGADDAENSEESLLTQIIGMLKAQANAEEAKAEAAAEESRAKQSEWSAIAAEKDVRRQEELATVQAQVDAEKKKEKDAKKYAELARFNVSRANGSLTRESASFLQDALALLVEDGGVADDPQTLQKQKQQLAIQYKVNPNDNAETKNYKATAYRLEMTELNARIARAQLTQQYQADQSNQQNQNNQQNPNQQNNQPNQNTPQNQQNTQQTAPAQPNVNAQQSAAPSGSM